MNKECCVSSKRYNAHVLSTGVLACEGYEDLCTHSTICLVLNTCFNVLIIVLDAVEVNCE